MEKKNVELFLNLYSEFENQCKKIATKLNKVNSDYGGIDYFYIDTETQKVCGYGEVSYGGGSHMVDYFSVEFDANLLSYTDEELDSYVNNLLEKKRKEEEEKLKKNKEKERKEIQREIDYLTQKLNNLI